MPLILRTIPCLSDNYAYLIHDPASGATAVVDVPDAPPILKALKAEGWTLTDILLTHHHWDHIDGVPELLAKTSTPVKITGASADAHRLPKLDHAVADGDVVQIGTQQGHVLDVSGHTIGHIAFHFPDAGNSPLPDGSTGAGFAFTADSLMAMGCGRLFEGPPEMMWRSLSKLAALPPNTIICSGHEYTETNLAFAQSLNTDSPALRDRAARIRAQRADNLPTVPSLLADESATNPFLRASDPSFKAQLGMPDAEDAACFAHIRSLRDNF